MGLFDHVVPSERATDLALLVKRIRKRTGLDVVPMLVVEGRTDEPAFGPLCRWDEAQVFSAGTRDLVEQLLDHLDREPIDGCDCVYLVDCDGRGKTARLAARDDLIVTETCDLEADLVKLGVVERIVARAAADGAAQGIVADAVRTALPLSVVRRAAHRQRVSMKVGGEQLHLCDLPEPMLRDWEARAPEAEDVLAVVAAHLGWDDATAARVAGELGGVSRVPDKTALGKDILDVVFRRLLRDGHGDVRGWSRNFFHQTVRRELASTDLPGWVVGQRLARWSSSRGHVLIELT